MNPFLHDTVARPLQNPTFRTGKARSVHRLKSRSACVAAGLAAFAWSACALATDLNSASLDELRAIRGIGPKTAQIILEERQRGGQFDSFEDLSDRVKGIGPRRARALQAAGLSIGPASHGPSAGEPGAGAPSGARAQAPMRR
ncbi:ComEA family DNA-binding protein [Castellaniella sp.]|uniref:ComEA family DNA-binding protein n=1 Tax=Castellaniella sp. TaxID=1955812 RepID=UPI003565AF91